MISHMISQLCDITVWLWYHSQTMISHMMSCMYIMWCSSTSYMMSWVISHCDITIMWYHRENTVISHEKSQATKRLIICDITFIFHIICDITYDITVMCQWYHTVMSHVITHPSSCPWLKLQASQSRLPPAQPPCRCQRPEAQTPSQRPTPRRHRRRSGRRWRRRGERLLPCLRRMARGQPLLLHCCKAA
jgi:hypothetical protein